MLMSLAEIIPNPTESGDVKKLQETSQISMRLTVLGRLSSSFRQTSAVPSPSAAGRTSSSQP